MIDAIRKRRFDGRRKRSFGRFGPVVALLLLGACAGNDEEAFDAVKDLRDAYNQATTAIQVGNYRRGIQILELIQARYPFSEIARQVQLDLMYAYYKSGQRELAIEAADTFMRENPIHARVDYALYIKGLAYFEDGPNLLERLFRKDVANRPPKDIDQSYQALRQLVQRYPASEYAPDAEQRLVYLKNRLAEYENTVADYYMRRGAYVAALNRARNSLETYNGAEGNEESLRLMIRAYERLGMDDLAADTRRVLQANFPNL